MNLYMSSPAIVGDGAKSSIVADETIPRMFTVYCVPSHIKYPELILQLSSSAYHVLM